jgi:hypothetical protein
MRPSIGSASEFLNRLTLAYKDRATSIISVSNFMS